MKIRLYTILIALPEAGDADPLFDALSNARDDGDFIEWALPLAPDGTRATAPVVDSASVADVFESSSIV